MNNSHFKQKYGNYALVAGGSDGLGYAFAESVAKRGLNLVLIARNEERLHSSVFKLKAKYQVDVISITGDLADLKKIEEKLDSLDVPIGLLIYNAAYAPIGLFEKTSQKDLLLATDVNVKAPLLLTKLFSKKMIQRKKGGIVLMSSLAGTQGSPKLAVYAATKSFNAILAEGLWNELKPHGIDVIASCAGAILTPGYQKAEKAKPAPGTLTAEKVAEITLNSLGKRPIVVPGIINKIARFIFMRLLSRKTAIEIMSKNTGGLS